MVLGQDHNKNHIMFFFEQKNHILFDGKNEPFCERKLECKPKVKQTLNKLTNIVSKPAISISS